MFRSGFAFLLGVVFSVVSLCQASAYERLAWDKKDLLAGKADLGDGGYTISRVIGEANFSPEFRMPLQLVYNSMTKHRGVFGDFWTCPQLESRVFPRDRGAEWTTPWGDKISFFQKEKANKDTIELYKEKMKGQGLFSPYSDWEAKGEKGDWSVEGRNKKEGWGFEYKDSCLQKISAPSGRSLVFHYKNKQLVKVIENDTAFIELNYNDDKRLDSVLVNGVKCSFGFSSVKGVSLPEKQGVKASDTDYSMLSRIQYGSLEPETFSYDDYGCLSGIKRGELSEKIVVEHETVSEREKWLDKLAEAEKKKISKTTLVQEKITGRILSDKNFTYAYPAKETVSITNAEKRTASYNYSGVKGVLKVKDFAGLETEICYFRRYDVAFNGKLRQIRDARDRVVLNNRYDKKTGELIRSRDMFDNETYYSYDKDRNLVLVSRSEENIEKRPLVSIKYDGQGDPVQYDTLDKAGKSVFSTKLAYNSSRDLENVSTDEGFVKIRHNGFGYPSSVSDAFNRDSSRTYDKFNRLLSQTTPDGVLVTYSYDPNGMLSSVAKFAADNKKELLSSVSFNYDKTGRVASVADNSGRVKKFDRDTEGRISTEYFPDDSVVKYSFDKLGHLAKVVDQNGNPIEFEYNIFGKLEKRANAENQLVNYSYDKFGLAESMSKKLASDMLPTQEIKYSYDNFDRVTKIDYGNGEIKTFKYDNRSKVLSIETSEKEKAAYITTFAYNEFDKVARKTIAKVNADGKAEETVYTYAYTNSGKLLAEKITFPDGAARDIKRAYDKHGRLTEIKDSDKTVKYAYDKKSKLATQEINGVPVKYSYTKFGQLASKIMGDSKSPMASLKYVYAKDGSITAREVNGKLQKYEYDLKGQLLVVKDSSGKAVESYSYDKAGNILEKTINRETTKYTYDSANQLVSATLPDGSLKKYAYDAAGRMISEATPSETKTYTYGWLDKVTKVDSGATQAVFSYFPDGQLAEKNVGNDSERFYWDGLALIKRDAVSYINEPAVTGGNPVVANDKVLFNDILGTSLGAKEADGFKEITRSVFGETNTSSDVNFFTGKPNIPELGYSFLFRNYRADLAKWQTSDPLGFPDGWNNFTYVENKITAYIDPLGGDKYFVIRPLEQTYQGGMDVREGVEDTYVLTASLVINASGNNSKTATLNFILTFECYGVSYLDEFGDAWPRSITVSNPDSPTVNPVPTTFSATTDYYTLLLSVTTYTTSSTVEFFINWAVSTHGYDEFPGGAPAVNGLIIYTLGIKEE